jgi:hypothetical protein
MAGAYGVQSFLRLGVDVGRNDFAYKHDPATGGLGHLRGNYKHEGALAKLTGPFLLRLTILLT